ncbi:MAG: restriction endonuclease subunit S, partial [Nitrospirae bacterium]|nr:restriction endonuclease subunit S [Nitrospirota bacterium]
MNRYPKYKDSGIEWLGEIPEHWEVKPLKHIADIVLGKMLTPEDKGGYLLKSYLRAQNITWEYVDTTDIKEMWFSKQELKQYLIKKNDLLISEGGEVGRTAIWNDEIDECYIQNSVHKVKINHPSNPRYYLYHSEAYGKGGYYETQVNKVSIGHLTREKLKDIRFLFPLKDEQTAIASYLDRKTQQIDKQIENENQSIALLQEYRTA